VSEINWNDTKWQFFKIGEETEDTSIEELSEAIGSCNLSGRTTPEKSYEILESRNWGDDMNQLGEF